MNRKNKTIIWLCISVISICVVVFIASYAYFSVNQIIKGSFEVDIASKGIDTFQILEKKDSNLQVTFNNFMKHNGHDVSDDAKIQVALNTTNDDAKYCYSVDVVLPDEIMFEYTNDEPELVLDVQKSEGDGKYFDLIKSMDITQKTGKINVPIGLGLENYVHTIEASKKFDALNDIKANVTFVYKNIDQEINNYKNYRLTLDVNVKECE